MNGGVRIRRDSGFTLVELLVVIVILSVLTALITAAASGAITQAKETAIKVEINGLDQALKNYRNQFGEYPPSNFSDTARVKRHLQRRFPRANFSSYTVPSLTPAQALVFWLQGFYQNPLDPLTPFDSSDLSEGREPFFDFDPTRLIDPGTGTTYDASKSGSQLPYYAPTNGLNKPYLYFEASTYKTATSNGKKPYFSDLSGYEYENTTSFQLISAGLDGDYGAAAGGSFPSGNSYEEGDWDNICNFGKRTLKVSKP